MSYSHDGLEFDVTDTGPIDGEAVVLLHGFPQTAAEWDQLSPLLHEAGYRTIAPTQRGYSPGARPRGRTAYRSSKLVGDVDALIRRLDAGPVHLVGHDWGAAVAWAYAARHPERLRSMAALSVAHPGAFMRSMLSSDQARRSWYFLAFQPPRLPERLLRQRGGRSDRLLAKTGLDRAGLDRVHAEVLDTGALTGALNWYRAMPFASPSDLRLKVTVPTTLIWSDADAALGRRGCELTERYVDAPYSFHELPGVSHWIPEQAPEQTAEILLRFWTDAEVSSPAAR